MKATVVGAGINGCAAAWALRRRGVDVTLVDQFAPGHTRGSSHGRSRIFRLAYPEQHWVELAETALSGWRELEQETGTTLLELYGLVELCSSVGVSSRDVLETRGIEHRLLERGEIDVTLPDGWIALWQPDAGIVRADLALDAFRGDLPVEQRRVGSVEEVDGDVVIVTAGPWAPQLLSDLPVRVTRETVAYFAHDGEPFPSVVELDDATRHHAMYALHDPQYGLKAGAHHAGPPADPDTDGSPDAALVEQIADWVRERFPHVDPEPVAAETCVYTTTADESFILERRGRVVVGSACSGHAFKFAPAIGKRLAELAIGR
jgi:sarcosine oxidase